MEVSWEILYALGSAALFFALVYGMWQYKTRNRANDRITDEATREQYTHPDSYPERREELNKELRSS